MPIITPPNVVQDALDEFLAPLFKNQPQRKHLAHYLTGLMISENKTVAGMTSEMPNASDQSLSESVFQQALLTEVDWDHDAVNKARVAWLQQFDDTKFHPRGVIAIDDVLIDKSGKFIKQKYRNMAAPFGTIANIVTNTLRTLSLSTTFTRTAANITRWNLSVSKKKTNVSGLAKSSKR